MQLDSVLGESIQFVFKRAGSKTRFGGKKKKVESSVIKKKKKRFVPTVFGSLPHLFAICVS